MIRLLRSTLILALATMPVACGDDSASPDSGGDDSGSTDDSGATDDSAADTGSDFNECLGEGTGNNCSPNATCTDQPSSFTCTCNAGYTGDGVECSEEGDVRAFPSAEGFGRNASGGRGGQVIKVTNLNDSGEGSFREALTTPGARTVVFEVGGTIELLSDIRIEDDNITIAGQTAPGDGILITGVGAVDVSCSNVVIRYLRFRKNNPGDGASAWGNSVDEVVSDVIYDHCSFSWAGDENMDISHTYTGEVVNITVQNSIFAECDKNVLISGESSETHDISWYRNLHVNTNSRNVRYGFPVPDSFGFEMINNLIYGWGARAVNPSLGAKFSVINNKFKPNANTTSGYVIMWASGGGIDVSHTDIYQVGNDYGGEPVAEPPLDEYFTDTPYNSSGIVPLPSSALEASMLSDVGCSYPTRDAVDLRLISDYNNGTGTIVYTGTVPTISGGTAVTDVDDDGMADTWETSVFGDLARDGTEFSAGSVYTDLERYINALVGE